MKINEIVLEGLLGSIGKGLADIVAPGAVEKNQEVKASQAIDKKSNIVNYQGRQYQWLGNQWGQLNPNAFPDKPVKFQNAKYRWLGQQWGQIANFDPVTKKEKYSVVPADIQKQLTASFSKPRGMTVAPTAIQQQLNILSTRKPMPKVAQTVAQTGAQTVAQTAAQPAAAPINVNTIQPATSAGAPTPAEQAKLQQKIQAAMAAQGK